jgi:lipopolysaccharide/colanic/teichoic acid biosynthesis glycosyltransferase
MVANAHLMGASSTSNEDRRITRSGHYIRKYKIDELTQFWNVITGEMSLVGPRPQVPEGVQQYTEDELHLLDAHPGITDFASIVFSDEGDILEGTADPDQSYDELIRPWKSRLGLIYISNSSLLLDIKLIILTVVAVINRQLALRGVVHILQSLDVDPEVINVSKRQQDLRPSLPPGN